MLTRGEAAEDISLPVAVTGKESRRTPHQVVVIIAAVSSAIRVACFCTITIRTYRGGSLPSLSTCIHPYRSCLFSPTRSPHSGADANGEGFVSLRTILTVYCSYPRPHRVICGACLVWGRCRGVSQGHVRQLHSTHANASCDPGRNLFHPHHNNNIIIVFVRCSPASVRTGSALAC